MKPEMHYKRTVEPTVEPVTLAELQAHALGYNSADSAYMTRLIKIARELFEEYTGLALLEQTWTLTLEYFPDRIKLKKPPLRSVTSIAYFDPNGDAQTVTSSIYRTKAHETFSYIEEDTDQSWPATQVRHDAITITFKAGIYASDNGSPTEAVDTDSGLYGQVRKFELAQQAIMILCDHLYRNRAPVAPVMLYDTPLSFRSLVQACRVEW